MGLFGVLNTAVSGLQAQAFAMQNISGNIANSQTTAYKGINTNFVDLIPDAALGSQTAGGVLARSDPTNSTQGVIQSATVGTFMAINGDGFFAVKQQTGTNGTTPILDSGELYTRRGDFQLNSQGYLVNGGGYFLEGIPIDPDTGNPIGSALSPLQFNNSFLPAQATNQIIYGANLPAFPLTTNADPAVPGSELLKAADFTTSDPTASIVGSEVPTFLDESLDGGTLTVYNGTGAPANIQFRWAKVDDSATGTADTWNLFYLTNSSATGATPAWINIGQDFTFDGSGQLNPAVASKVLTGVTIDGNTIGDVTLSFSGGLTQFSSNNGSTTVNSLQQNGYAAGQLVSLSVGNNGRISGSFSNGKTVDLAEVPLFSFASPNSLKSLDGGGFQVTADSGPALTGASGNIVGGSLEESNADIADQFTKLIVTQQAYSANTRVITTANEMSQDLLNMLR
ncbi:MAG TPA: flagellar hook-basal body complex protein [Pseudolabrys sp.]|jgi:flagellar hook protein FlgE|nr:flagellar hook-basal body complex protein [Pseudolabrys sp.]